MRLAGGALSLSAKDITLLRDFEYGNNGDFLKVFILSYLKLLDDSPLLPVKPRSVYISFLKKLTNEDLRKVIKEFSSYSDEILSNEYMSGSDSSTRVFHPFMIKTPVFKEYHTWIRTGQPELLKYVLSFLRFGKKLAYTDSNLDATAFRGWQEVEDGLSSLTFQSNDVRSLKNIIAEILPGPPIDQLLPRFGPGKVAERSVRDVYDKLDQLTYTSKLEYTFLRERPFRSAEMGFCKEAHPINEKDNSLDVARLKFVPKDISKSRSICMEPNGYMYFQQEVKRWIYNAMGSGLISRFVSLQDQRPNQEACVHGSLYGSSDTIDLSSASDSVHIDLVRKVFSPSWLFYLLGSRSSRVEIPDGSVVKMNKFAPMGSALCFPVQCIIFTAVCLYEYASRVHGKNTGEWVCDAEALRLTMRNLYRRRSAQTPFGKRYEPPVVFGDDIICDSRVTDALVTTLSRLGFRVNVSKSFTGSQSFRESCGVYAYEGQDVTPVMFRLPFFRRGKLDASVYTSLIEGINQMRGHGYHHVASFWLSILKGCEFKYPLPFTTDPDGFGIFTLVKHKVPGRYLIYDANLQTYFEEYQGIGPRKQKLREPERLDEYRLDQWWRSRIRGGSTSLEFGRSLRVRPQETWLAPVWARCEQ